MNEGMTVLLAKWESSWFALAEFWRGLQERIALHVYHPEWPDDNERFEYELAQCISEWFWPPMIETEPISGAAV